MLEQKPRPEPGTTEVRAAYKQRRKLFLAIVLLLVALTAVLVKDHQFWFGADETPAADETSVESTPNTATHAPSAPAAQANKHVAAKGSTEPVVAGPTVIATDRATLPPLDVEVIAGDKHRAVHPGSNSVTIVCRTKNLPVPWQQSVAIVSHQKPPRTVATKRCHSVAPKTSLYRGNKALP